MSGKLQHPVDTEVTIRVPARVAFELRYILPVLTEALVPAERESTTPGPSTTAMLDQVVAAIDEALPASLRGLVDEDKIAEYRLNVIDQQRDEGHRPTHPAEETYTREQLLSQEAVGAAQMGIFNAGYKEGVSPVRAGIEAALDAIDKGKGGDDA
jgi:hypothetical protein